jgi:hypothetical protein
MVAACQGEVRHVGLGYDASRRDMVCLVPLCLAQEGRGLVWLG